MKKRPQRRAHGVPATDGPLRTYQMCMGCRGAGMRSTGDPFDPWRRCETCKGSGKLELLRSQSATSATKQAIAVVRSHQAKGRLGRNM